MTALATPFRTSKTEATPTPVMLSIVIPAYNESFRIGESIRCVVEYLSAQPFRSELILVDDGSSDDTVDVSMRMWEDTLSSQAKGVEMHVLRNDGNRGKGYSVRQGMLMARGEWILFTDADLSSPIDQFDRLFVAAQEDAADVAIGSRRLEASDVDQPSLKRSVMSAVFSWIVRLAGVTGYADTQCGFKLYRRSAGRTLASLQRTTRWSFDVEHLMLADRLGYQVTEVGVRWAHQEGSKLHPIRAAFGMVWDLTKMRWAHRKLGRVHKPVEYSGLPSTIRIGNLTYTTPLSWLPRLRT